MNSLTDHIITRSQKSGMKTIIDGKYLYIRTT